MDVIIETERLFLRELILEDTDRMFLLDSNPEVMKYVGQPVLTDSKQSEKVIETIQSQYKKFGIGRYAVIEKESGLLIGWSGLKFNDKEINGHQDFYELGYRFLPEFWGKGYATEAGIASLNYGFQELHAEIIYAYADSENEVSNAILKKLGFEGKNNFIDSGDLCIWYELKKDNFKINLL